MHRPENRSLRRLLARLLVVAALLAGAIGSPAQIADLPLPPGNVDALNVFGVTTAGAPLLVAIAATPGSYVSLMVSGVSGNLVLPFGTLQLAPASIGLVNTVLSGPSPAAVIVGSLPASLPVGAFFALQACIVDPAGAISLTNTVTITVTAVVAPMVIDITTSSILAGASPTAPIPSNDVIQVLFDQPIDPASLNSQENLIVRNLSVTTPDQPGGILVPILRTVGASQDTVALVAVGDFGPGPYQIRVTVGGNANPAHDIVGFVPPQPALANSMTRTFTTQVRVGVPLVTSISENFATTTQQDSAFQARFADAEWNQGGSEVVAGIGISGSSLGGGLGTRAQFTITPTTSLSPPTLAFFSPFDDDNVNNFGPAVNPNGGSHLQLMYLTNGTELPQGLAKSFELFEWGSAAGSTAATYGGFEMKLGHTSADATSPFSIGLTALYAQNFDFDNPQNEALQPTSHPGMLLPPNEAPVTVVAAQPYTTPTLAGGFVPFPLLDLPFDYDDNRTELNQVGLSVNPNLLVDINILPGSQPTSNFIVGTNASSPVPMRRLAGAPSSVFGFTGDPVIYHMRMTVVDRVSSVRTLYYDSGLAAPTWASIDLVQPTLPANTGLVVRVQGADQISGGMLIGQTPLVPYRRANGMIDASALTAISGKRFVRLQIELENDTFTNTSPSIEGFVLGYF